MSLHQIEKVGAAVEVHAGSRSASVERNDLGSLFFRRMPISSCQLGPDGILDHGSEGTIRARGELFQLAHDVVVDVYRSPHSIFMFDIDINMSRILSCSRYCG